MPPLVSCGEPLGRPLPDNVFQLPFPVGGRVMRLNAMRQAADSIWSPMAPLLGTWEGTGGGEPGIGKYERTYVFIFDKKFIEIRNKSVYPPSGANPKGETHEDIGYISFDKARRKFVLRQFHIEGYVNQYVIDSLASDGKVFVFVSEAIENIPKGWHAKESYQIVADNKIVETFELAPPDKPFEVYTRVTLKKVK
ncbi:MAG TPA: heme-binding beta-barrel domain-containing protein [Bacteroidota bacterium]|nr:heme-binding beta-barrel domain-containing protein [Bacteroidota bacterium]